MAFKGAQNTICHEVTQWDGVAERPHRFGGTAFYRSNREVGHIHRDGLVDIPFRATCGINWSSTERRNHTTFFPSQGG